MLANGIVLMLSTMKGLAYSINTQKSTLSLSLLLTCGCLQKHGSLYFPFSSLSPLFDGGLLALLSQVPVLKAMVAQANWQNCWKN